MTERTPLADDDVIDLLRRVSPDPSTLDVEGLVTRSRRSVARRRAAALGAVTTGVAAAAVAVGLVVAPGLGRTGTVPALPAATTTAPSTPVPVPSGTAVARPYLPPRMTVGPATPPTGGGPSSPSTTSAHATAPAANPSPLLALFGDGWQADTRTSGFAGDIRVVAGSAAARGLPPGYDATVRPISLAAGALDLERACRANTEKGLVTSACTPLTTPDGTTVQRQDGDAVLAGRWSYSSIRLIHQRPDGSVQLVDLIAAHEGSVSSTADRARAAAWLAGELTHLEQAVVDLSAPVSP